VSGMKRDRSYKAKDPALLGMMNAIREVLDLDPLIDKGSGFRRNKSTEERFLFNSHEWPDHRPKPPRWHS